MYTLQGAYVGWYIECKNMHSMNNLKNYLRDKTQVTKRDMPGHGKSVVLREMSYDQKSRKFKW